MEEQVESYDSCHLDIGRKSINTYFKNLTDK